MGAGVSGIRARALAFGRAQADQRPCASERPQAPCAHVIAAGANMRTARAIARSHWSTRAGALAAVLAGMVLVPQVAWAVDCSNGGTGPNPAGSDAGQTANTACGA